MQTAGQMIVQKISKLSNVLLASCQFLLFFFWRSPFVRKNFFSSVDGRFLSENPQLLANFSFKRDSKAVECRKNAKVRLATANLVDKMAKRGSKNNGSLQKEPGSLAEISEMLPEALNDVFRCFICMEKLQEAHLCPHCR